ncbi:MAG: response regulator [Deltaproteobacteria bacterium]|nr:response regulator [Deltaproteobacteria bacterium]
MSEKHILVIEDEEIISDLIEHILTAHDIGVTSVADGESAWELLSEDRGRFHSILLDRQLPGMNGMELLRRIKADPNLKHIPVIMETSLGDAASIREGLAEGAYYYLTKPLQRDLLWAIVEEAIDEYHERLKTLETLRQAERSLDFLDFGVFRCRTLNEARELATILARACPDPGRVVMGLQELLINAVEHGNLGITYDEKKQFVIAGTWISEVERRLSMDCYGERKVVVELERRPSEIMLTIGDEGVGFDCQCYLDLDPERVRDPNGRGIAMARMFSFDGLEYQGNGNTVKVRVNTTAAD